MYRVLVVDNEAIERKALKLLISRHFSQEVEEIADAKNGHEAVSLVDSFRPDVILMDIQMPIMNGLEASTVIKNRYPDIEIIILTAYEDFGYAKKAIELQVVNYLLKPVSEKKLQENLTRTFDRIETKRTQSIERLSNKDQMRQMKPLLGKQFMKDMINGHIKKEDYKHYDELFSFETSQYFCMVFEAGETFSSTVVRALKHKLNFIFKKVFVEVYMGKMVCLVYMTLSDHGQFEHVVENTVREVRSIGLSEMVYGISSVYSHMDGVSTVYIEACTDLNEKVTLDKKIELSELEKYPIDMEQKVVDGLMIGNEAVVKSALKRILQYLETTGDHEFTQLAMNQFCYMLYRNLVLKYGTDIFKRDIQTMLKTLGACKTFEEVEDYITSLLMETLQRVSAVDGGKTGRLMMRAKEYIESNFQLNSCSLSQLADTLEVSPYYLSRLFKRHGQDNFKDQVISLRMEKAKDLLRTTNLTTKEISHQIGYDDPNYFSRAFKKYAGMPATIYAKKVR